MHKSNSMTYIFLMPAIFVFLLLTVYPLFYALNASFQHGNFFQGTATYTGFSNYLTVFKDDLFRIAFKNTIIFVILAVFFETILGLLLAVLFNRKMRYRKILRSIVLIPMMLPPITVALTWKMMYEYDYGVLNHMLGWLGIKPIEWISSTDLALYSIIFTDIWQWTPFAFLVILANLQSISPELYESAQVDGASAFQQFKSITLPLVKTGIYLVVLLRTIDSFRVFDKVYVLTGGGPGHATETLSFYIYRQGFSYFDLGLSAASAIVMVGFILIVSMFYIRSALKSG